MQKAPHGWVILLLGLASLLFSAACPTAPAHAELCEMSSEQMAGITGTGFSSFIVDGNRVRADFNISAATYTEVESLKMGYWDNGGGAGWDQDWNQVKLGTPTQDMLLNGFFIEAVFDNISDPNNRRLTSVFFGFNQATGPLQANFASLSRIGDAPRANLGPLPVTFLFNSSELAISFQLQGDNRGIWVRFGEGTTRP